MVAWAENFDDATQNNLNQRSDLRPNVDFEGRGAWGPLAKDAKKAFPDILGDVVLTEKPWEPSARTAGAIAQNATIWVPDPKDPLFGIWGLAATSAHYVRSAVENKAPLVFGWYARLANRLPTYKEMVESGLVWQRGFLETYLEKHPNEDPNRKKKAAPSFAGTTYEIVGTLNGAPVPLTEIIRQVPGTEDYEMTDGADLAVTDDENDGFGLAGTPGAWPRLYPGSMPTQFGQDKDKAVVFWDGRRGQALPANILSNWFGPGWRSILTGE